MTAIKPARNQQLSMKSQRDGNMITTMLKTKELPLPQHCNKQLLPENHRVNQRRPTETEAEVDRHQFMTVLGALKRSDGTGVLWAP